MFINVHKNRFTAAYFLNSCKKRPLLWPMSHSDWLSFGTEIPATLEQDTDLCKVSMVGEPTPKSKRS